MELSNNENDWHGSMHNSIIYMLKKEIETDVTFTVGITMESQKQVHAHKSILIARSPVFYAMLCGPLRESQGNIVINDVDSTAFKLFLRCLYEDDVLFDDTNAAVMYYLSKKYLVKDIESISRSYLHCSINEGNVCLLYDSVVLTGDSELIDKCIVLIDENLRNLYTTEDFIDLSPVALAAFVSSKIPISDEYDIFRACISWAKYQLEEEGTSQNGTNMRKKLAGILEHIHFPVLNSLCYILYDGLLTTQEIQHLQNYQKRVGKKEDIDDTKHRAETSCNGKYEYEVCNSYTDDNEKEKMQSSSSSTKQEHLPELSCHSPDSTDTNTDASADGSVQTLNSLRITFPTNRRDEVTILLKRQSGPELTYTLTHNVNESVFSLKRAAANVIGCDSFRVNLYTEDGCLIDEDFIKKERHKTVPIIVRYTCIYKFYDTLMFEVQAPSGSDYSESIDSGHSGACACLAFGEPSVMQSSWVARPVRFNNRVYNPQSGNPQIVINFARDCFDKFVFDHRRKDIFRAKTDNMIICHNLDNDFYYMTSSESHDYDSQSNLIQRLMGHIEEMRTTFQTSYVRQVMNQYKQRIYFMHYALNRFMNQPEITKRVHKVLPP